MPVRGPLAHIDLSIGDPRRSIPFYAAFLEALGYRRAQVEAAAFQGPEPERAAWTVRYASGAGFELELRPALPRNRERLHDGYAPGLHHLAFHAESPADVDRVHLAVRAAGGTVLDAPAEYSGAGYSRGYYAAFFADPDGVKLEVVYEPKSNP